MRQLSMFHYFLFFLIALIIFSGQVTGQECPGLSDRYRQSIVSLTVDLENKETGETRKAYGTGFIVHSEGYVLTAYHVVSSDEKWIINSIKGALGSLYGQYSELRFVTKDQENRDIALLQFKETRSYVPVPLGKPGNVKVGKKLCSFSFSFPLTLDYFPTNGTYSGKREERWTTDLSSNIGESGAPIFSDATGRVVAMKYGTIVGPVAVQNVNLLTPLNFAKTILETYCDIELTDN